MDSDNSGAWIGLALVGVIVVVGFIYFFTGGEETTPEPQPTQPDEERMVQSEEETDQPTESPSQQAESDQRMEFEMPEAVNRYGRLAEEKFVLPEGQAKYKHEYTRKRLEALGDAFVSLSAAMNGESNQARRIKQRLNDYGAAIQEDWRDRHADDVREAFFEVYEAFDYLKQLSRQAQLDLTELRSRAEAIDPDTLYLEQKERAERFFESAARTFRDLERGMNG